ncbi:hypothetical protein [Reichenbachiella ulvae]|uniref:Uncharacterized protein n=1 Tax=Reichenbachiella ulvae TaxID=2980104 RepID=A0ABT3CWS6_9BACT|nr:hypothetical protein [Reichenbachiella ulvae]MCV9387658.1 hypothetical protein [Reichenbachiella ulvae]
MKWIKSIILAFVLFSPAAVYLFLQGFGENKFEIPVFYKDGLDTLTSCGQVMYPSAYKVEYPSELGMLTKGKVTLFDYGVLTHPDRRSGQNNILSFLSKYKQEERIQTLALYAQDSLSRSFQGYPNLRYVQVEEALLTTFAECQLFANPDAESNVYPLVLVDELSRIRGYFDPMDLEEIDRLNTEVYILLNE